MALTAHLKRLIKLQSSVAIKLHCTKPQSKPQNLSLNLRKIDLIRKKGQSLAFRSQMRKLIKDMTMMTSSIIHHQLKLSSRLSQMRLKNSLLEN